MLIDFTVENFRSIKEPVTLSMVAAPGKKTTAKTSARRRVKSDDEIAPPFRDEARNLSLLPVVGIFGANASGKSNVIQALSLCFIFMLRGSANEDNYLRWFPTFGLDKSTKELPVRIKLRTVTEGTIFTYTLVLNHTRILQEVLEYIPATAPKMRTRLLFERSWQEDKQIYIITNGKDFGNAYREIQESLREYEPFIGLMATRLNVEVVRSFTLWLSSMFPVTFGSEQIEYQWAVRALLRTELSPLLKGVTQIVRQFDTGITNIEIEAGSTEDNKKRDESDVWVTHEVNGEQVRWLMQEESTGTQRLFSLAFKLLGVFHIGGLLLVDELGSNIHPNITRTIVRMFQSEKTNPKRAQLIFTSHDNTLQRGNLLRRDQIWFTQKRSNGSTELYPLSDFKPRNDLAIDKAYLEGRFGAVPILPDEEEMLEPVGSK